MYCRNCGNEIDEGAAMCVKCGFEKNKGTKFCFHCGKPTEEGQSMCTSCGFSLSSSKTNRNSSVSRFKRAREGKLIGGVFSGTEKYLGVNKWIGRLIAIFLPLWPIWLIAYIIVCVSAPMDTE